jgi:Second Messenger Oligonucleotide or Dinucleotide Synthetase domain
MPYTVAVSFDTFHDNINLSGDHRATANSRRDSVVAKLSKDFNIVDSFSTGSIAKMTALHGHADLDVMVILNWSKHIKDKRPTQVLQSVRNSLAQWRNAVRRNGQAVTLSYETWPDVDIVPVSMTRNSSGEVTHYNVPNSHDDTWIKSRPKSLAAAIEAKSTECGWNFRRIIKMIKHWNRIHSDYLSGYHIEVLALKLLGSNCDKTPWEVHYFFDRARALLDGPLYYDTGFVDDYLSNAARAEVKKRLETAHSLSLDAWFATHGENDDHEKAIGKWRQIFGDKFPAYAS